jgi:hypothetical protein
LIVITASSLAICSIAAQAQQSDNLKSLDQLVVQLCRAGEYVEATEIAKQALARAERKFGPDGPTTRLNNLGALYNAQSRYAEEEPTWNRLWNSPSFTTSCC